MQKTNQPTADSILSQARQTIVNLISEGIRACHKLENKDDGHPDQECECVLFPDDYQDSPIRYTVEVSDLMTDYEGTELRTVKSVILHADGDVAVSSLEDQDNETPSCELSLEDLAKVLRVVQAATASVEAAQERREAFLKAINGREIYSVTPDGQYKINGYFYDADGQPDKTWRHVEFNWAYIDSVNVLVEGSVDELETECKQYIEDFTPEEVLQQFACYCNDTAPLPRLMSEQTDGNTPVDVMFIDVESLPPFPDDVEDNPSIKNRVW